VARISVVVSRHRRSAAGPLDMVDTIFATRVD